MSTPSADRNLLFGLLALQMDFLTREQLLAALHAWKPPQTTPLAQILREHDMLSERRADLVERLVADHLAEHGGDPRAGMKALRVEPALLEELLRLAASDVQDSSLTLPHSPAAASETATLPPAAAHCSTHGSAVVANGVRFRRLREHARGGLGEVFVALDEELNREVALKEIQERFADLDDARTRFVREAEITGKLEHPGVVPVYGLGSYSDGRPFYAMRFIHGQSMEDAIARFHKADEAPRRDPGERSLALRELLGRFVAVCNAVAYAHSRGVIHRDLKPANAMLGEYGETLVVDWGLAKQLQIAAEEEGATAGSSSSNPQSAIRNSQSSQTGAGAATEMGRVVGTPAYMPPEQASGRQDQVGTASDVFALGATLYCLLTGQAPYSGVDALIQAAMAEYVPARQRKRSVPAALEAVCAKAMAAKPEDRYTTARDLAEEVQRFLADEPVQAYREPLADRARRWGRRNRSVVSAAVVLLLAGVVGLSVGLWAVGREQERTQAALERAQTAEAEAKASARLAAAEKDKAEKAEKATLADYRASTDDAIEQLIGSKPVLGIQEKSYLEKTLKRWQTFAARTGDDERSRAIRAEGRFRVAYLWHKLGQTEEAIAGYREALAIRQKLADEFPAVIEYRQTLAAAHDNLGLLLADRNQGDKAVEQLHTALAIKQKLADEFPTVPAYRKDLGLTHNNLGIVLAAQNQWDRAAEQYHKAQSIQQQLADEFPTVREYHKQLGVTHHNLGVLLTDQNQWEKAAEQYGKALAIRQKLADEFLALPVYRNDLAATHNNLGRLLETQKQWEKSASQYEKALDIWQKLADEFPALPRYRQDLATVHNNLGNLLEYQNHGEKSAQHYNKALAIRQKLADELPVVPAYRQELAATHESLAILLATQNQGPKAVEQHHKALAIQQKLADEFPAVPAYRKSLAGTHSNLGILLARQNQGDRAAEQYHKALAIQQKLADEFPSLPGYRQDLATTHNNLGFLLKDQNLGSKAVEHYHKALVIQQKLADEFPAVAAYHQSLALTHNNLGNLLARQNQGAKAAEQYRKALAIRQKLADEFPGVPEYRNDLADIHNSLGVLLADQHQESTAAELYRKALAIRQKLADEFPAVPEYRKDLASTCNNLGNLLTKLKQEDKAFEQYGKALAIQQKLADDFPAVPAYRKELARTRNNLGNLLTAQHQWAKATEQYQKALVIQQKLVDDFPAVTAYQVDLGGNFCNYGHLLRGTGKPADSLPWFDKAIGTLTRVHQQDPRVVPPRLFLRNSFWGRALAHDQMEKYADAVKDWTRAIELTPRREQARSRVHRAHSRVRAGLVADAVAEVAELRKSPTVPAAQWYDLASILAVASARDADKRKEYADRAMRFLRYAVQAGYTDAAHLAKDKDLDALRQRDDFKKLLVDLESATGAKKTKEP